MLHLESYLAPDIRPYYSCHLKSYYKQADKTSSYRELEAAKSTMVI